MIELPRAVPRQRAALARPAAAANCAATTSSSKKASLYEMNISEALFFGLYMGAMLPKIVNFFNENASRVGIVFVYGGDVVENRPLL